MKYLSHPHTGCNRKRLLHLYKTLIQPILDYGSPIYGQASQTTLKALDPIQNAAIRIITGAYRTSPSASLCAEASILPLHFRRMISSVNLLLSVAQNPNLPISYDTLLKSPYFKSTTENIQSHTHEKFEPFSLPPILLNPPPWKIQPPTIHFNLTQYPKSSSKEIFIQNLQEIYLQYPNSTKCFTDGSKSLNKTACAFSIDSEISSFRIYNHISVASAERFAIYLCLKSLRRRPDIESAIILTDSLSTLPSHYRLNNPANSPPH